MPESKITVVPLYTEKKKDRLPLAQQKIKKNKDKMVFFLFFTQSSAKYYDDIADKYKKIINLIKYQEDLDKFHQKISKSQKDIHIYFFLDDESNKTIHLGKSISTDKHDAILDKICSMHNTSQKINYQICTKEGDKKSKKSVKKSGDVILKPTLYNAVTKEGDFKELIKKEKNTLFIYNDNTCRYGKNGNAVIADSKYKNKIGIATGVNIDRKTGKGKPGIDTKGGFPKLNARVLVGNFKYDGSNRSSGTSNCVNDESRSMLVKEIIDRDFQALEKLLQKENYKTIRYSSDQKGFLNCFIFKKTIGNDVLKYINEKIRKLGDLDLSDCQKKKKLSKKKKKSVDEDEEVEDEEVEEDEVKSKKTKKKTTSKTKTCYLSKKAYGLSEKSAGIPDKKEGGKYKDGKCIFPFYLGKKKFTTCQKNEKDGLKICATKVDPDSKKMLEAGICQEVPCDMNIEKVNKTKKKPRVFKPDTSLKNTLLKSLGKKIYPVKGDGNCLFHSLDACFTHSSQAGNEILKQVNKYEDSKYGVQDNHMVLRLFFVNKILNEDVRDNIQQIVGFISMGDDSTLTQRYLKYLKDNKYTEDDIFQILEKVNAKKSISSKDKIILDAIRNIYCEHMSREGVWADDYVARKICEDLNVRLVIYQIKGDNIVPTLFSNLDDMTVEEIGLFYNGSNHYEAVINE